MDLGNKREDVRTYLSSVTIDVAVNGYIVRPASFDDRYVQAISKEIHVFETLEALIKFLQKELLKPAGLA